MSKARELSDLLRGVDVDGDLTVDTDTLVVDSTNNRVGIGTSSGANRLEVSGAIVAQGAATAYTNTGLYLQNKGSSVFDVGAWRSGASVAELSFSTDSGSDAAPVERMRIESNGNLQHLSKPAHFARAWVNFNGTGTVAIRGSGNVSSITDLGTGQYTVNFATSLAANYAITATGCRSSNIIPLIVGPVSPYAPSPNSLRFRCMEYDSSSADSLYTSIVCH